MNIENKLKSWITLMLIVLCCAVQESKAQQPLPFVGPYLQNLYETEVTIAWISATPSVGWVELAPDDGSNFYESVRPKYFDSTDGVKQIDSVHAVKIEGLKPGTTYRYRIYNETVTSQQGQDVVYGTIHATDVYSKQPLRFTTNNRNNPTASFLVLNDIHEDNARLKQLLEKGNFRQVESVFYNGDMVNVFNTRQALVEGFLQTSVDLFAKEKPMYYARGNHETRGQASTTFHSYISPREEHLYYMFRQGPVCFIILDTGEDKPDSDIEYHGRADFDAYRSRQIQWLKKVVQSDDFLSAPFKVVLVHIPPYPLKDMWHGQREVLEKVVPVLNKAKIDLLLSGHHHDYYKTEHFNRTNFPILVNDDETVVKAQVIQNELDIQVLDQNGRVVDTLHIKK